MTHDIDGNDLSLVVANSRDIKSGFTKIKDLLNRSASTSTTIDMNKAKWDQSDSNTNAIKEILNSKWDANKQAIEGGSEQQWSLDARGLTLRSPSDVMNLLRAVNSVIAISNDGGNTYRNALTSKGLVAEEVYGQLVAGNNLNFTNESGSFMFDENGVRIDGASLTLTGGLPLDQIAPEINDLLDTAVKTGVGYNFVVIDNNGIIATHSDGSTTQLSGEGLMRKKAGVLKPYSYLTAVGSSETGSAGHYFDNGGSRFTSGLANGDGIPNITITLPADFQGKEFSVSLSVKSSAPFVMANRDGDPYYVPYVDLGNFLEIVNLDTAAGTFEVKGYGRHMILDTDGAALHTKYWEIEFSYMVVA
jgi:hypothetical protein